MNKVFKLTIALLCLTLTSLLVSCDIDIHHHINESKILGTWVCTYRYQHRWHTYTPIPPYTEDDYPNDYPYSVDYPIGGSPFDYEYDNVDEEFMPRWVISFKEDGTYNSSSDYFGDGYWSIIDDTLKLSGDGLLYHVYELTKQKLEFEFYKSNTYDQVILGYTNDTVFQYQEFAGREYIYKFIKQ